VKLLVKQVWVGQGEKTNGENNIKLSLLTPFGLEGRKRLNKDSDERVGVARF
jgi:hypothetical protein